MSYALIMQIGTAQRKVAQAQKALDLEIAELRKLEASRVHCEHTFEPAVKGYEHEGGYCSKCGINELYAKTLKDWQKTV